MFQINILKAFKSGPKTRDLTFYLYFLFNINNIIIKRFLIMNINYQTGHRNIAFKGDMKMLQELTQKAIKSPLSVDGLLREVMHSTTVKKADGVDFLEKQVKEVLEKDKVKPIFGFEVIINALQDCIAIFEKKN